MKLSTISKANAAIETGVLIASGLSASVKHRVRGVNCTEAQKLRAKLEAAAATAALAGGERSTEDAEEEIERRVIAEAIWLDSTGLEEEDGAPIKLTPERKAEILADPAMSLLRSDILSAARRVGAAEIALAEQDAKN